MPARHYVLRRQSTATPKNAVPTNPYEMTIHQNVSGSFARRGDGNQGTTPNLKQ